MAKYRLRKSDDTFEVERGTLFDVVALGGRNYTLYPEVSNALFEPVAYQPEPTVDPAVEKLATIIFDSCVGLGWVSASNATKNAYHEQARAVLDAGYAPPPEPKVIRVGSRVRHRYLGGDGEAQFIDGRFVTVKWDNDDRGVYSLTELTLIEEGTPHV